MTKLLCTADLHLGRRSSLPGARGGPEVYASDAWRRIVDCALAESVAAVLIAGDLVDDDRARYEATGPFERELNRLAAAAIPCYVVAGNHDHEALQRLAAGPAAENLRWLGRDGSWEEAILPGDVELAIHGWSFPASHHGQSPLANYPYPDQPGRFTIGLLHADLGQPGSRYAPVHEAELTAHPYVFWLLGHIHAHRTVSIGDHVVALYPGSPQALDLNEPGAHGAWLLELLPGGGTRLEFVPLSSVRYERPEIDLTNTDPGSLEETVWAAIGHLAVEVRGAGGAAPRWLCCRPRLVGSTSVCGNLGEVMAPLTQLVHEVDGQEWLLDGWIDQTEPVLDQALESLATGAHPPAVLARLLLALQAGGEEELVTKARELLEPLHGRYPEVAEEVVTEEEVRHRLLALAHRLLATLQRQQEAAHVAT
ncbi:MAG: DNA repair exonuclease [Armatimonadetes bacterium]|nr:DNA repair exonuclease [Armatimonadota bacterium]